MARVNLPKTPTGSAKLWASSLGKAGRTLVTLPVWVVMLIMTAPPGLDYEMRSMATTGDTLSRITWLYLTGSAIYVVGRNWARAKVLLRWINPFLLAFMLLATASMLWTIDSGVTSKRVMRAATELLIAIGFVLVGWRPQRFQEVVRAVVTAVMVASVIFVIADPEHSIHHAKNVELKDAWHGITMGKNILGSFASIGVLVWLHGWLAKEVKPIHAVGGIALGVVTLIMTRSSTSLMATGFAVIFMLMLMRSPVALKRYMPYLVTIFAILILVYAVAILHLVPGMDVILKPITMLSGKDLTFTGRTAIWEIINENIAWHPWLGGGYGAYWVGALPSSPSYQMLTRLYFYPSEGHNGYIDIVNDLGFVGGAVLVGYFISYIRQSIQLMRFDRAQSAIYLSLLFREFLADMSESHWFFSLSVDFVLFAMASACMARTLLQRKLDQQAAVAALDTQSSPAPVRRGPLPSHRFS